MKQALPVIALVCCLCCSCSTESRWKHPPAYFDPLTAGYEPRHRLDAKSDEDIKRFVDSHLNEEVYSLRLNVTGCTPRGYSHLRRLRGLYALALSGPKGPFVKVEHLHLHFGAVLSDEVVREIAQVKSLGALHIWYGSLSAQQNAIIKRELPDCKIYENHSKPHRVDAKSDEDIKRFVDSHLNEEVYSVNLAPRACTPRGYSHLRRLRGLYVLTLGGLGGKLVKEEDGWFFFSVVLSDEVVREIAQLKSLRALNIWYGSLSPQQKAILKRELPDCKIHDNLNML